MSEERSRLPESIQSGKCVPSPRVSAFSIERLLAPVEEASMDSKSRIYGDGMNEEKISVAADSSMSIVDEVETLEDIVCSTSPEPEISYGKLDPRRLIDLSMKNKLHSDKTSVTRRLIFYFIFCSWRTKRCRR